MFNIGLSLKITTSNLPGPASKPGNSVTLLDNEPKGFALDFITNDYSVKTTSDIELIYSLLGNEWSGTSIDFTTDLYINRI